MGFISGLARIVSFFAELKTRKWKENGVKYQHQVLRSLVKKGKSTQFGKEHDFENIHTLIDFQNKVPLREYEDFSPYIKKIKQGIKDVLWTGVPLYLSTTSGTTSGMKYIPISAESISNQINGARLALLLYIYYTGKADFLNGKLLFLSGSPELEKLGSIPVGRLSGIINHHIPEYLKRKQLPSFETNCIENWEEKIEALTRETLPADMRLISGIPPWVQMYFDRLQELTGKPISEVFPNFSLFVYGGVNFEPYKQQLENRIGKPIPSLETYPASEGFFAFQDDPGKPGLLLLVNSGIFYEFIPVQEIGKGKPTRLGLEEVRLHENYALVVSTNAGLWAYLVGDTVKFISKNPYRILVTGRIKHFISAFGEHVIAEEVEGALYEVSLNHKAQIIEFTVAPEVNSRSGELPYHEWFIEFGKFPVHLSNFAQDLDKTMQEKNHYYKDLIQGKILQPLIITLVKENTFIKFMRASGKLGGQNKVPHLSNNREIAEELKKYT